MRALPENSLLPLASMAFGQDGFADEIGLGQISEDIPRQHINSEKHDRVGSGRKDLSQRPSSEALAFPREYRKVLTIPKSSQARDQFRVIQKWKGEVTQINEDTFQARLIPLKGEGPEQNAELYFEDISDSDRPLVAKGAIFYWSIGYQVKASGQRMRSSVIRFRRLPAWTKRDLNRARKRATELKGLLDEAISSDPACGR